MKHVKGGKLDVNHKKSHFLVNETITVTCEWFQSGGGTITCGLNETWSGPLPRCVSGEKYSQYTQ